MLVDDWLRLLRTGGGETVASGVSVADFLDLPMAMRLVVKDGVGSPVFVFHASSYEQGCERPLFLMGGMNAVSRCLVVATRCCSLG